MGEVEREVGDSWTSFFGTDYREKCTNCREREDQREMYGIGIKNCQINQIGWH